MTPIEFVEKWRIANGIVGDAPLTTAQLKQFVTNLQGELSNLVVRPTGWAVDANPLLYTESIYGVPFWRIAETIANESGGKVFFISNVPAGEVLRDQVFMDAVAEAVGGATPNYDIQKRIFNGEWTADNTTRLSRYAVDDLLSLDDFVSREMVIKTAQGDLKTFSALATGDRVFAQTELYAALFETPKVTSIDGIPKQSLLNLRDSLYAEGIKNGLSEIKAAEEAMDGSLAPWDRQTVQYADTLMFACAA